jgi:hypothetical protein
MSPSKRYAKKQAKARQRRRHTAHERLRQDQQRAQRAIEALEQTLHALGLPDNLVQEFVGALPKRSWMKRLRRLGQEVLVPLWRHVQDKSPAILSRWQWTWVVDDSVFKKYGQQLGLVEIWWSGQEKRVCAGIDGVLLVVVIGDGQVVVSARLALARESLGAPGTLCQADSDESDV